MGLYGAPGPQRDRLVSALCLGEKTATSSLLAAYGSGADVPQVGEVEVVLNSALMPEALVETTAVRVIRLANVDLAHAMAEGFADVATWRRAHEKFWATPEALADLDDPAFRVDDDTPVVTQEVRVIEVLKSL